MNRDFAEYIKEHIREYLPLEYQDADVSIEKITKSNDRNLTGLIIHKSGDKTAPTIYLEPYADQVDGGRSLVSVMQEIAKIQTDYGDRIPFEVPKFADYGEAKPMLFIKLCDPERNQAYLKDKPSTPCGNLVAIYGVEIMKDDEGVASAVITDSLLKAWGVSKGQLHQDAVLAENKRNPVCFYRMDDVMSEIMFSAEPENLFSKTEPLDVEQVPMYVLTNQGKVNGAGVLARDGVAEKIGELIGANYYILPSSIHELLIIPDNGNMQTRELEDMVKEINATQVAPAERLSDKVQYYDRATKTLGRKQEKGLLEQLADKKKQVQQQEDKTDLAKQKSKSDPSL